MGDLAFGQSFNMMKRGDHWAIKLLYKALTPIGFGFPTWFFRLLTAVPGLTSDWWCFIGFCAQRIEERRLQKPGPDVPDIASVLFKPLEGREPTPEQRNLLHGDLQLIVIAGSDTVATTLTSAIWELARRPDQIKLLRDELQPFADGQTGEVLGDEIIAHLPHLNAVTNEVLRLHPPVPSMIQRKTPPAGIEVDGKYIPGDTIVSCPQHVIGRNERTYRQAKQFIPERWTVQPELIKEKKSWAPFSVGPYGCIGRPLALMMIRITLSRLIIQYDICFAKGEDGSAFEGQAREKFTMEPGPLMVSFMKF